MTRFAGFLLIETLIALTAIAITLGAAADLTVMMMRALQRVEAARVELNQTKAAAGSGATAAAGVRQ